MTSGSRSDADANLQSSIAVEDYGHALIHLAWYRADKARFLMFGFVELYPTEFPAPSGTPEQQFPTRRLGRQNYLYAKRTCMTAQAAVDWYLQCIGGTIMLPGDLDAKGNAKHLATAGFVQEPRWPKLIMVPDTTPFIPYFWQAPRVHHLLQPDLLSQAQAAVSETEARNWLSEQMFVDFEAYSELVGSLHLVAPDPILRAVAHSLLTKDSGQETSVLRFYPRSGKSLTGLRLALIDRRQTGVGNFLEVDLTSVEMQIPHPPGTTGEIEMFLRSEDGNLQSWSRPTGFAQAFDVNMMIPGPHQTIVVPETSNSPSETYTRALAGHQTTVKVGEPRSPKEAISLLARAEARRELRNLDARYPEKWFHGERQQATRFVRDLIASAKQRLWIVDPYFTTIELIRYALATSSTKLPVLIVTSAEAMTKKDRIDPHRTAAEVFDARLPTLANLGNFTIRVLKGTPAVHDRFLVVDDSVWFSGNSLHTIGERAGMVVRLRNSEDVIKNLDEILHSDRTASWQDWIAQWRAARKQPRRISPGLITALGLAAGSAVIGLCGVLKNRGRNNR
jgi:hypothetical protein